MIRLKLSHRNNSFYLFLFLFCFYFLYVSGIFYYEGINLLNPIPFFELVFFSGVLIFCRKLDKRLFYVLTIILVYLFLSFTYSVLVKQDDVFDFLQAYKSFFYVAGLTFFVGREIFPEKSVRLFFKITVAVFVVKYTLAKFLSWGHIALRPGILYENNFELYFLYLVFYFLNSMNKQPWYIVAALVFVTMLSGSRSASLIMVVVFIFSYVDKFNVRSLLYFTLFSLMLLLPIYIFQSRYDGDLMSIDRFQFASIFFNEIIDWKVVNYLFGNAPITPLSQHACNYLSFYSSLFSYSGDGSCYSVILHAYVLRTLFDHGVLGLLFMFFAIAKMMKISGFSTKDIVAVIMISFINALSVSAMNSSFFALAMVVGLTLYKKNHTGSI